MNELRQRLLTAPRWVIGLVTGIPFGVIMGAETGLRHGRWTDALIEGAIAGVFYGAVMALFMHRRFGRYREAMGDVPRRNVRRAAREARKGRVPEDPEARRAASRILDLQLTELRRQRRWAPAFFLLIAALSAFLAVADTPWWWVTVPCWLVLLAMYLVLPQRLERRLDLLRD